MKREQDKTKEQLINRSRELRTLLNELAVSQTKLRKLMEKPVDLEHLIRFLAFAEFAADGLYLSDLKGHFLYGNRKAEEIIGYKRGELIGKNFLGLKLLPARYLAKAMKLLALNTMGMTTGPDEFVLKRKDGSRVWAEISTIPIKQDGQLLVVGFVRDVTKRKQLEKELRKARNKLEKQVRERTAELTKANEELQAEITQRKQEERALRESEAKFRNLAEQSPNMIFINKKGQVVYANKRCEEMMGYKREELYSPDFDFLILIDPKDKHLVEASFSKHMKGEEVTPFEYTLLTKDGKGIEAVLTTKLIDYEEETAILGIVTDITKRKQAEKEIKKSRKQLRALYARLNSVREEERTMIAGEIHDELGQALVALKMELFSLRKRLPKEQKKLIEKLDSIKDLVNNSIKSVKRISLALRPGILDNLGVVAAIEYEVKEFQKRTGVNCKLELMPEDVKVDSLITTAIYRIFQEALTNVSRHADATLVNISFKRKTNGLALKVEDNGRGITQEQISDSRSLGLHGMRERALYHGGEVKIQGIRGKGTTITISIPLERKGDTQR